MTDNSVPQTFEELREVLAGRVGLSPADISEDGSLFELGLDSVTALSLIGSWRRAGLDCPADEFIDSPTLADWWRLVAAA
jgi:aryl carrier-like protein